MAFTNVVPTTLPPPASAPALPSPSRPSQLPTDPLTTGSTSCAPRAQLNDLPIELLDWIAGLLRPTRDLVPLAATRKVYWNRWGRDWPLRVWRSPTRLVQHPRRAIPLYRFAGARKGGPGYLPFVVRSAEPAGVGHDPTSKVIIIRAFTFRRDKQHHVYADAINLERWYWRAMDNDGIFADLLEQVGFEFVWNQKKEVMVSTPAEWFKDNCLCAGCRWTKEAEEREKKPVMRQTTLSFGPRKVEK